MLLTFAGGSISLSPFDAILRIQDCDNCRFQSRFGILRKIMESAATAPLSVILPVTVAKWVACWANTERCVIPVSHEWIEAMGCFDHVLTNVN
ncbi:MAG: hypothetical protein NVS1B11_36730 [Terriglobales bacterium]